MAEPALQYSRAAARAKCPACDSVSDRVAWTEAGYQAKQCGCGNVFIDPPPSMSDAELAYDGHFRTYYSRPAKVRLDWVERFCKKGRLLEVGSGSGELLRLARQRGYDVAGVDPNPVCAEHLRREGFDVECAFIERSALPRDFDVVYHIDLLSHFPDPLAALKAMSARLKPNGVLCFEVGLIGGLSPAWYRYMGGVGFPQHRFLYSLAGLRGLLRRAELHVSGLTTFGLTASLAPAAIRHLYGPRTREWIHRRHAIDRFRPQEPRLPPEPDSMFSAYEWLTYVLRYRLGGFLPAKGPMTAFVAARPL